MKSVKNIQMGGLNHDTELTIQKTRGTRYKTVSFMWYSQRVRITKISPVEFTVEKVF